MSAAPDTFIHRFEQGMPSAPTLLLLHGTGGNEDSLIELGRELFPGARLLSPRGNVLEHGMPRFFRRLSEGVFDLDDLRLRTTELNDFIISARIAYDLGDVPIYAVGYSNGANIAANLLLNYGTALQGAVLFRPMLPETPEELPPLPETPVLIASGEYDRMIPRASVEELSKLLIKAGAHVTHNWEPSGHELTDHDIQIAREWLKATFA